ncbi:MAG: Gx transporter family protein [Clostridium sp.]|nr:Gx transporter family protein [Clostridium sp.]MCM1548183.1 Gx transporter family protein [Ruminococcus sp.]
MPSQKAYNRNRMTTENIALCGILLALSAGISAAESLIPLPLGVKPGFSNLPVMYSMSKQGGKYGFAICVLKSVFVLLTRGAAAFFMSLTGGVLSYILMLLIYKKTNASLMLISISGALMHNFGQLCAASVLMNASIFGYSPVMIISGCIAGAVTGVVLKLITYHKQGGKQ